MAGKLSKGLKQRVAIARALLHQPPVLLLDEPTSGLDPASARQMRDLILELRSEGRAVLVSTHNLAEAEELADRIAVLKTELLAFDTPAALRRPRAGRRVDRSSCEGGVEAAATFADRRPLRRFPRSSPGWSPDRRAHRARHARSAIARGGLSRARRSGTMTALQAAFGWHRVVGAGAKGRRRVDAQSRRDRAADPDGVRLAVPRLPRHRRRADDGRRDARRVRRVRGGGRRRSA